MIGSSLFSADSTMLLDLSNSPAESFSCFSSFSSYSSFSPSSSGAPTPLSPSLSVFGRAIVALRLESGCNDFDGSNFLVVDVVF